MRYKTHSQTIIAMMLMILAIYPTQTVAFNEQQCELLSLDVRGLIRGFANASQFPDQNVSGVAGIARIMVDGDINEHWGFEINAYQTYIPEALVTEQSRVGLPLSTERSAFFEASFSDRDYVHLIVDRLALYWSNSVFDFTIGRQAINLATTFYFTPNDFFAPFAAQTFYRVYKPGVDALRLEIGLGEFSQLSLMSVLGYKLDAGSNTGWSNTLESQRSSYLVQWSSATGNMDTSLTLGRVKNKDIVGVALQGEFFEWLGLRLEGHHSDSRQENVGDYQQFNFGLEHRWENSLELRLELFYNGLGTDSISHYHEVSMMDSAYYLARRYSALGGRYEITPLLIGEAVIISNFDDHSHLLSLNATYSLSDESEVVVNLNIPVGDEPANGLLKSEFGSYPTSLNVEARVYF